MNFQTYIINFRGADKSYFNTVSINLDLSWSEAKLLKIARILVVPTTLSTLDMGVIVLNSNLGYTIVSDASTTSSTITKELMRFQISGDDASGWTNYDSKGEFIIPTGMATLKLWLSDINGNALELNTSEQAAFKMYIVMRVYG